MSIMLLSLTGCEFVRAVAGRPSDKDIAAKRIAIMKAEEEALQHRLDSIRIAGEKAVADSVAAFDFFKESGVTVSGPGRIGGLSGTELEFRYYIIVGAFRDSANAGKLFDMASEKGYAPVLMDTRGGMVVVGIAPENRISAVREVYERLINEPFCPKEAWILVSE